MKTKPRSAKDVSASIFEGLNEALLHSRGKLKLREYSVEISPLPEFNGSQIKTLRKSLNFTQELFARTLGVSIKTVEAWESGRNIPAGPAQRMMEILKKNPRVLEEMKIVSQK